MRTTYVVNGKMFMTTIVAFKDTNMFNNCADCAAAVLLLLALFSVQGGLPGS